MNYLAHIYLADISETSKIGNFLGDFVRGNIQSLKLCDKYKEGIYLHRKIDVFTDTHPIVKQSKNRISKSRRRFAGIIIDLAYDHFLAKNWVKYSKISLHIFVQNFYAELENHQGNLPHSVTRILPFLFQYNWLENYKTLEGTSSSLNGLSKRFKRENTLYNSIDEIVSNYDTLENDFELFFSELISFVSEKI